MGALCTVDEPVRKQPPAVSRPTSKPTSPVTPNAPSKTLPVVVVVSATNTDEASSSQQPQRQQEREQRDMIQKQELHGRSELEREQEQAGNQLQDQEAEQQQQAHEQPSSPQRGSALNDDDERSPDATVHRLLARACLTPRTMNVSAALAVVEDPAVVQAPAVACVSSDTDEDVEKAEVESLAVSQSSSAAAAAAAAAHDDVADVAAKMVEAEVAERDHQDAQAASATTTTPTTILSSTSHALVEIDPLYRACERGDLGSVMQLLSQIKAQQQQHQLQQQHHANEPFAAQDNKENFDGSASVLALHGTCTSSDGVTPLHIAARSGNALVVKALIDADLDIDLDAPTLGDSYRPLYVAVYFNEIDSVAALLESGKVDINAQDSQGDTCLHVACHFGFEEIVQLLLSREECDVNCKNNEGRTPLSLACAARHAEICHLLVASGAVMPSTETEDDKAARLFLSSLHLL